jgi:hypothetical protein
MEKLCWELLGLGKATWWDNSGVAMPGKYWVTGTTGGVISQRGSYVKSSEHRSFRAFPFQEKLHMACGRLTESVSRQVHTNYNEAVTNWLTRCGEIFVF